MPDAGMQVVGTLFRAIRCLDGQPDWWPARRHDPFAR
jgi:hypothetical protein